MWGDVSFLWRIFLDGVRPDWRRFAAMAEDTKYGDLEQLKADVQSIVLTLDELKAMVAEVHAAVRVDHLKLEKLEETTRYDHKMIRALEETRRSLEVTGRIQVGRPPVGL